SRGRPHSNITHRGPFRRHPSPDRGRGIGYRLQHACPFALTWCTVRARESRALRSQRQTLIVRLAIVAILTPILLAACGGEDEGRAPTPQPATQAPTTPASTPAATPASSPAADSPPAAPLASPPAVSPVASPVSGSPVSGTTGRSITREEFQQQLLQHFNFEPAANQGGPVGIGEWGGS